MLADDQSFVVDPGAFDLSAAFRPSALTVAAPRQLNASPLQVNAPAPSVNPDRPALDQSLAVIPYGQPGSSLTLNDVVNGRTDLFDAQDYKAYTDRDPTTGFSRNFDDPATQAYYGLTPQRAYDLGLTVNPPGVTPQDPGFAGVSPMATPTEPSPTAPAPTATAPTDPLAVTPPGTVPAPPVVTPTTVTQPSVLTPDFGIYNKFSGKYEPPTLMPADDKFSTPYYAAYTNSGDFSGAVPAVEGAPVRIIDNKTGQVVYSGVGPKAAETVAGIANAASQSSGRKASWTIQTDFGADGSWTDVGRDLVDPKSHLLGTLLDIAAPFILNALLPGVGLALTGALGSIGGAAAVGGIANTLSGLAQGEGFGAALKGGLTAGAISGLGAGVLGNLPSNISAPINNATRVVQGGFNTVLNPLTTVLSPLDSALAGGIGGAGDVLAGVRGGIADFRNGVLNTVGLGHPPTVTSVPGTGPVTDVSELVVNGLGNVPQIGVPTGLHFSGGTTDPNAIDLSGVDVVAQPQPTVVPVPTPGGVDLSGVDVVAQPQTKSDTPVVTTTPTTPGVVDLSGVTVTPPPPTPTQPTVPLVTTPPDVPVIQAPQPTEPVTPVQNPSIPGTLPGVPVSTTTSHGKYAVPTGPGTRESLDPIFRATLPPPTFGHRTALPASVDTRYAIEHPEARFFNETGPQARANDFAVIAPSDKLLQGVGDLNRDGQIDELDLAIFRHRFGRGYAGGGDVRGPGDGRSDSIDARLSDGEYVVDAETVALLGNGSSQAGAKALDDFRVNIRKDKGRHLAAGKLSAKAKPPQRYLRGT